MAHPWKGCGFLPVGVQIPPPPYKDIYMQIEKQTRENELEEAIKNINEIEKEEWPLYINDNSIMTELVNMKLKGQKFPYKMFIDNEGNLKKVKEIDDEKEIDKIANKYKKGSIC